MSDHDEVASAQSGAANVYPKQCSALRKGDFVVIKNRPCKIVEMTTSKTGKHGHAKVHMITIDIFTGKKLEDICPSTHNMECPVVVRKDFELMDIDHEGFLSLMDPDSLETKEDLQLPDSEVGTQIKELHEKGDNVILVTAVSAMGEETVLAFKNKPNKD
jgi:translation initiation factor 5A